MAEYMKFPVKAIVHKVPQDLSPSLGALIEPLSCSIHAVERGEIQLGDTVAICGCGTLGLGMIAVARLKSPGCLIALDMKEDRLERARKCGADVTINPGEVDAVQRVMDLTEGYGCDVYIEASGHPTGVELGLRAIRKLGTFVEFSVMAAPVTADWTVIGDTKELTIHGSHLGPYCYPKAIRYLQDGTVDGSLFVTHEFPLERFAEAFEVVHSAEGALKVLLTP
jgi:threonine dehydrogenase-like Zn-dependent dehydrogenase